MYNYHESKSGKFLRSTSGGIAYYTALITAPVALIYGISSLSPDYNKASNPDSQQAISEYINEGQSLNNLLTEAQTLHKAALNQNGSENVLAMQQDAQNRENRLSTLGQDFASRILTDTRLTEADYRGLIKTLTIDNTRYVSLSGNVDFLEEARAETAGLKDRQAQAQAMTELMNDQLGDSIAFFILNIFLVIGSLAGGITFCGTGISEDVRNGLSDKLDDMSRKRMKPKH